MAGACLELFADLHAVSPCRSLQLTLRNNPMPTFMAQVIESGLKAFRGSRGEEYPPGRSEMPKNPEAPGRELDEGTWNQFAHSNLATPDQDSPDLKGKATGASV